MEERIQKRPGRPKGPAPDTRGLILKAASKVFAEQGYAGASLSQIAGAANINQSLIYHHFQNKLDLWRAVKEDYVQRYQPKYILLTKTNTVEELIEEYIHSRFDFYFQNPEILRILLWQLLDPDHEKLSSVVSSVGGPFYLALKHFQDIGVIGKDLELDLLVPFFADMAIAPLHERYDDFQKSSHKVAAYKKFVIQTILKILQT